MAQITTLDTVSKLLKYVTITLPPFVTKSDDSYIRQFLSSILEVFKINIDQLNQIFNNTFISEAEEGDLEKLILDVSDVTRKDGESDEDYRNRFYKYVYRYNATTNSIKEIVYDSLGYYPIKLTESGARTAYWGLEDLVEEDRVANSAYFYDDVNEYTAYWGRYQSQQSAENEKYFVGIIHLVERPPQEKLDELCDVIERVRKKGTNIYLQFLDNIDIILEPVVTIVEEDAFTFAWRLVPSAFSYEVQIDDDPLFGSPTTYITSSTSYNFSGLSGGVTYYTRVRYENDDGYSEWTEPVETTTPSSIGTPIATEETNVGVSGKLPNIFTTNWGSASGATSYLLTIADDLALTLPISGFNQLNVGGVVSYNIVFDLDYSNSLISWNLQDNASTISSENITNLEGNLIGTQTWNTSMLSSDTYSLRLDGSTNYVLTNDYSSSLNEFTIKLLIKFDVGDIASIGEHVIFSKYNTNYGGVASGGIFYISFDSVLKKLYFAISDNSTTFGTPLYKMYECTFDPTEGVEYLLHCAFRKNTMPTTNEALICINGVSQTLVDSASTISNITTVAIYNNPFYLGAYVGVSGTTYKGKFICERCYFYEHFLDSSIALKDAQSLGLISQTLYYAVKATDGVITSPYSNVITVNK